MPGRTTQSRSKDRKRAKHQSTKPKARASAAKRRTVTFECGLDPLARRVSLVGTFNDWNDAADPMQRKHNRFVKSKRLPPGEHEYKFLVDGVWREDPEADAQVENGFGTRNSVVRL